MLTDINAPTCNTVRDTSEKGAAGCNLSGNRATGTPTNERMQPMPRYFDATRAPRTVPVPTTQFPRMRRQTTYAGRGWFQR